MIKQKSIEIKSIRNKQTKLPIIAVPFTYRGIDKKDSSSIRKSLNMDLNEIMLKKRSNVLKILYTKKCQEVIKLESAVLKAKNKLNEITNSGDINDNQSTLEDNEFEQSDNFNRIKVLKEKMNKIKDNLIFTKKL